MADPNVIREFLVSLGVKIDEAGIKRLHAGIAEVARAVKQMQTNLKAAAEEIERGVKKISLSLVGMATGVVFAADRMAKSFFDLYFASQRVGASAQNILAMRYVSQQIGLGVGEVEAAAAGLLHTLRQDPGARMLLQGFFGVDPGTPGHWRDMTVVIRELADAFGRMVAAHPEQEPVFARILNQIGAPIELLRTIALNAKEADKALAEYAEKLARVGLNTEQAVAQSVELTRAWRNFWNTVEVVIDKILSTLLPDLTRGVQALSDFMLAHARDISSFFSELLNQVLRLIKEIPWQQLGQQIEAAFKWLGSEDAKRSLREFADNIANVAREAGKIVTAFAQLIGLIADADKDLREFQKGQLGMPGYQVPRNDPKDSWLWGKVKGWFGFGGASKTGAAGSRSDLVIPGASRGEAGVLNQIAGGESSEFKEAWNKFHATGEVVRTLADVEAKEGKSHAFGLYGFQPGTYREAAAIGGFDPNDISPETQHRAALIIFRKYGAKPWDASAKQQPGGHYPTAQEYEQQHPPPAKKTSAADPTQPPPLNAIARPPRGPDPNVWPFPALPHSGGLVPSTPPTAGAPPGVLGALTGPVQPTAAAGGNMLHAPVNQDITINAQGMDANEVGHSVRQALNRTNADMLRNLRGAFEAV